MVGGGSTNAVKKNNTDWAFFHDVQRRGKAQGNNTSNFDKILERELVHTVPGHAEHVDGHQAVRENIDNITEIISSVVKWVDVPIQIIAQSRHSFNQVLRRHLTIVFEVQERLAFGQQLEHSMQRVAGGDRSTEYNACEPCLPSPPHFLPVSIP